jgi:type IX secretion system PorP/SprF family membrane protein
MKKFTVVFLFTLMATGLSAQYIPNNAQTFQFMPVFNPAFTGIESFDDLKMSYRYQWSGFGKYSPKFINLSYNKRLVEPLDLAYNSLRLSDPTATDADKLPRTKRMIHGFGANIFHSKIGVLKSVGGSVNYSINYPVNNKVRFAAGVSALVENRKLDVSEVSVRDPDQFYNHLLSSSTSQTDLNIRVGILVYSQNYYLGVSYFPVLYTVIQASELAMSEPFYRASVQAGFAFPLNAEVTLKPSVIGLLKMDNGLVMDYNVKAFIKEIIWVGLTYRDIKSGVAIFGFNVNEKLSASYSYEMSLGEFKQFNDGSHELVLALRFNNFKKMGQYTW